MTLFKAGHFFSLGRITLRVLDVDLYEHSLHPTQLSEASLEQLAKHIGVKPHVADVVEKLLRAKKASPILYITRQNLKVSDDQYNFSSQIRRDFVKYVKSKFFSDEYLQRILEYKRSPSAGTTSIMPSGSTTSTVSSDATSAGPLGQATNRPGIADFNLFSAFMYSQAAAGIRTFVVARDRQEYMYTIKNGEISIVNNHTPGAG